MSGEKVARLVEAGERAVAAMRHSPGCDSAGSIVGECECPGGELLAALSALTTADVALADGALGLLRVAERTAAYFESTDSPLGVDAASALRDAGR